MFLRTHRVSCKCAARYDTYLLFADVSVDEITGDTGAGGAAGGMEAVRQPHLSAGVAFIARTLLSRTAHQKRSEGGRTPGREGAQRESPCSNGLRPSRHLIHRRLLETRPSKTLKPRSARILIGRYPAPPADSAFQRESFFFEASEFALKGAAFKTGRGPICDERMGGVEKGGDGNGRIWMLRKIQ